MTRKPKRRDWGPAIHLQGMPPVIYLPATVTHFLKHPPPPSWASLKLNSIGFCVEKVLIGHGVFTKVSHWENGWRAFSTNSVGGINKGMKTSSWISSHPESNFTLNLQHFKKKTLTFWWHWSLKGKTMVRLYSNWYSNTLLTGMENYITLENSWVFSCFSNTNF
jgi:hypothetical protein